MLSLPIRVFCVRYAVVFANHTPRAKCAIAIRLGWVAVYTTDPYDRYRCQILGRFADTYGRKTSLLRAELGLAAGFLICGFSQSLWQLVIGLSVQGLFGGTMAASNAYLATSITDKNALK
nr:MFS transporter [uncultured Psychrobacter sp.]